MPMAEKYFEMQEFDNNILCLFSSFSSFSSYFIFYITILCQNCQRGESPNVQGELLNIIIEMDRFLSKCFLYEYVFPDNIIRIMFSFMFYMTLQVEREKIIILDKKYVFFCVALFMVQFICE